MRATLVDWPDRWDPSGTTEQRLCGVPSSDPVVLVATAEGERWARLAGIEPLATVCPVRGMPWVTKGRVAKAVRRLGVTRLACASPAANDFAQGDHGAQVIRSLSFETSPTLPTREAARERLGLAPADRLVVPLLGHPSRIDLVPICMASSALSIAEFPVVFVLPARGANARRARAMLSNMDRVLEVIAWDGPTSLIAPAADAILWGPDAEGRTPGSSDRAGIEWAVRMGVPVLCPAALIRDDDASQFVPCNGTGGADISSAVLAALGNVAR